MKCLLNLLLVLSLIANAVADPVLSVHKLYGEKNLSIKKSEKAPWYRAHLEQDADVGARFRTDAESRANLRFFLGGYASLGQNCQIQIVSERDVKIETQGLDSKKANFWAKFDKQKDAPVRIQTAGGVMGIKGTELVVQLLPNGDTKLSLIEGTVEVESVQGESYLAQADPTLNRQVEVTFGPNTSLLTRVLKIQEMQEELQRDLGPAFMELRNSMRDFRQALSDQQLHVRTAGLVRSGQMITARLTRDESHIQDTGVDTTRAADLLRQLDDTLEKTEGKGTVESQPPKDPVLTDNTGLKGTVITTTQHPKVSWELEESEQYAVLFLDPNDDEQVYWVDETTDTAYAHPKDAEPLPPGDYRFWIVPLDAEGKSKGDAFEGRFRVVS